MRKKSGSVWVWLELSLFLGFLAACHPRTQGGHPAEASASETLQTLLQKDPGQPVERVLQTPQAQEALRKQEGKSWQGEQGKVRGTSVGGRQIIRIESKPIDGVPVEVLLAEHVVEQDA